MGHIEFQGTSLVALLETFEAALKNKKVERRKDDTGEFIPVPDEQKTKALETLKAAAAAMKDVCPQNVMAIRVHPDN